MHNFWRGTVSSICMLIASTEIYGFPSGPQLEGPLPVNEVMSSSPTGTASLTSASSMPQSSSSLAHMHEHHQVQGGGATVSMPSATHLVVQQSTDKAIINWDKFNVGPHEHVQFIQPSSESVTLNRVTGSHGPSEIVGQLSANGKVWLLNPSGVIIGPNAQIDAAGFMGSTSLMTNEDFLEGRYTLTPLEGHESFIEQHGTIHVQAGGLALISSGQITQDGWIIAKVSLEEINGQSTAVLDFDGDGLVNLHIPDPQHLQPEGIVLVRPQEAQALLRACVNTNHCPKASQAEVKEGRVVLSSGQLEVTPGSVKLQGKEIHMQGVSVKASQRERGGDISAQADQKMVVQDSTLDASGPKYGNTISLRAPTLALKNTKLKADGDHGGGHITVGGKKPDTLPQEVTVDQDSLLSASARTNGDGGSIMVWSDKDTVVNGRLEARGGPQGGNGGQTEVSARSGVNIEGISVDVSAPQGDLGMLILDPKIVTVNDSGAEPYAQDVTNIFSANANGESIFSPANLAAYPGNITLQANTDATVSSVLALNSQSLTIQAGRSVTISAKTSLNISGNLDVLANASVADGVIEDDRDTGDGNIVISNSVNVVSGTASFRIGDGISGSTGNIQISSNVMSTGVQTYVGDMSITGSPILQSSIAGISISNPISGGGNLTLKAASGTVTLGNDVSSLGDLTVTGQTISCGASQVTTTGNLSFTGPIDITQNTVITSGGSVTMGDVITGAYTLEFSANNTGLNFSGASFSGLEGLTMSSDTAITAPTSMDVGSGSSTVLYFGGSGGGSFDNVTLNGATGTAAAQYAALLPGTTGLYYVNGVLIGASSSSSTSTTTDPNELRVAALLPNFQNDSSPEDIEIVSNPLDAHSDLITFGS